jgi:cell division protein FtsL
MITTFYWIWSVIGILIILTIIMLLGMSLTVCKKLYKLVVTIYDEQQEVLGEIRNSVEKPKKEVDEEFDDSKVGDEANEHEVQN